MTRSPSAGARAVLPRVAALLAAVVSVACPAHPRAAPLILTAQVTLLERPGEPLPVRLAAQNLQNDLRRVFGVSPRIVTRPSAAGPVTLMIGPEAQTPRAMRPARLAVPESFAIAVEPAAWNPAARAVVLTGPDVLGTIYAIYQFSQDYLGVEPMSYWTGERAPRRQRIVLPAGLRRSGWPNTASGSTGIEASGWSESAARAPWWAIPSAICTTRPCDAAGAVPRQRLARLLPHHAVRGKSHRRCALKPRSPAIIRLRTASRS